MIKISGQIQSVVPIFGNIALTNAGNGTRFITENGRYNVTHYETVDVDVAQDVKLIGSAFNVTDDGDGNVTFTV